MVETLNEAWDPDAEARLTTRAIEARIQKFHQTIAKPATEYSKESGFLSLQMSSGHSLSSPLNLPSSSGLPSCNSSLTLSPTDLKTADCYSSQGGPFSPPPPSMALCDEIPLSDNVHLLQTRVPNSRPWSHGDLNPDLSVPSTWVNNDDQLPPYQQQQYHHQPPPQQQQQRPLNVGHSLPHLETTI